MRPRLKAFHSEPDAYSRNPSLNGWGFLLLSSYRSTASIYKEILSEAGIFLLRLNTKPERRSAEA